MVFVELIVGVALALTVVIAVGVWRLMRRAHDEFGATVRAFDEFRHALAPAVADLRADTAALTARLAVGESDRHHPAR